MFRGPEPVMLTLRPEFGVTLKLSDGFAESEDDFGEKKAGGGAAFRCSDQIVSPVSKPGGPKGVE